MSFFDDLIGSILNLGKDILGGTGSNADGSYNWVMPLITAGLTTYGTMNQRDDRSYADTQAGFEEQQALAREKLAQDMEIAKMNAAASGGSSGAQIAAAKIAAESQQKQMRLKVKADILAQQLQGEQGAAALKGSAMQNMGQAYLNKGQLGQSGLQSVAGLLTQMRQ